MLTATIDSYIATFPQDVQVILQKIRSTIKALVPKAQDKISYAIPTFDLNGKHLVHFAAFKKHVSFFPTSSPLPHFQKELAKYKTSKGTIQFPLDQEIPYDLIKKIVKFRMEEMEKINK